MALDEVRSNLDLYWKYKRKVELDTDYRSSDETQTLRSCRPMILERKLQELKTIADYDDFRPSWWDRLDSSLTLEENVDTLRNRMGADIPPSLQDKYGSKEQRSEYAIRKIEERQKEELFENIRKSVEEGTDPEVPSLEELEIDVSKEEVEQVIESARADVREFGEEEMKDREGEDAEVADDKPSDSQDLPCDHYGFVSLSVRTETLQLLDRAKEEYGFNSRRAVIEAMIRTVGNETDNFDEDSGDKWQNWYAALNASKDVPSAESSS